jgi:hypothetical protein
MMEGQQLGDWDLEDGLKANASQFGIVSSMKMRVIYRLGAFSVPQALTICLILSYSSLSCRFTPIFPYATA